MAHDLTRNSPLASIVRFALPLLIGNIFQQMYTMVDTFIVGRLLGAQALAAVGCTGSLLFLTLGFAGGVCAGMGILTAQRFGAGDLRAVKNSFVVTLLAGLAMAGVISVFGGAYSRLLLVAMQTPAEVLADAHSYMRIIFLGFGASMLYSVLAGAIKAIGDSRTPLIFLVITSLLNIVLDLLFILAFDMGVRGAAMATVVSQGVSALLCLLYLKSRRSVLWLTLGDWKISAGDIAAHLRIGLPMGLQMAAVAAGSIMVQIALNSLGAQAMAAYTAANTIDMFATMPLGSLGAAVGTFAAQNYGAGRLRRVFDGAWQSAVLMGAFGILAGVLYTRFGQWMTGVFITAEPSVIALGHRFLAVNGSFYFVLALLQVFRNTLQGMGYTAMPTLASVMEFIMRVVAAVIITPVYGFDGIAFSNPLSWLGACIPLGLTLVFAQMHRQSAMPMNKKMVE